MATVVQDTRPAVEVEERHGRRSSRWLVAGMALVLAAAVAFVVWLLADDGRSDAEILVDDTLTAWNEGDLADFEALYAEDAAVFAQLHSAGTSVLAPADEYRGVGEIKAVADVLRDTAVFERVGDVEQTGDFISSSYTLTDQDTVTTGMTMWELDDDGKIILQVSLGTWVPLED